MRKYMLCMMLGVAAGCAEPGASSTTADVAPAATENGSASASAVMVKFICPTMHWGGCRATVDSTLQSLPGVASLEIDADERSVTVTGGEGYSTDAVVAALEDCGFPAEETLALTGG